MICSKCFKEASAGKFCAFCGGQMIEQPVPVSTSGGETQNEAVKTMSWPEPATNAFADVTTNSVEGTSNPEAFYQNNAANAINITPNPETLAYKKKPISKITKIVYSSIAVLSIVLGIISGYLFGTDKMNWFSSDKESKNQSQQVELKRPENPEITIIDRSSENVEQY